MRNPYGPDWSRVDHRIVLGVPGSGKSFLARKITRRCGRVIYFDPHGDYDSIKGIVLVEPFQAEYMERVLNEDSPIIRVCIPAERTSQDVRDEFNWTCDFVRWYNRGCVLVADEVGDYKIACDDTLKRLHRNGHKQGVASCLVSQRAVDIPLGCRSTANRVYSLLQTQEDDIETLGIIVSHMEGPDYQLAATWRGDRGPNGEKRIPDPPLEWCRKKLWIGAR